jgi:phage terminase large subunit-like protein
VSIDREALRKEIEVRKRLAEYKRTHKMEFWQPYPKQLQFLELGKTKLERYFMAANRVGKTETGAFEVAAHMTGSYPEWWPGKKFDHPTRGWVVGESSQAVRDIQQAKLCGPPYVDADFGTGMIPKELFVQKPSAGHGVTGIFDTIQVYHSTNGVRDGVSTATFKSYEQGRSKFQGEKLDWGWSDEEPDMDPQKGFELYIEFLTRMAGGGILFMTATPLIGDTPIVQRFMKEASQDRAFITMILDEAEHWTEEEKRAIRDKCPSWQKDARLMGMPLLGQGRVWPYDQDMIKEQPIDYIPEHWTKLWGIDFGIGHPFAAVLILWDKDNDVIHVHACYRQADVQPIHHAAAIRNMGASVPVAWPQDGTAREASGKPLASLYREKPCDLLMCPTHATFEDGSISTEAGVLEIDQRMTTGRFKVAAHLADWFEEFRMYHRKDGQIVKQRDDLLSATRVAVMAKRFARAVPLGNFKQRKRTTYYDERNVNWDPWTPGE